MDSIMLRIRVGKKVYHFSSTRELMESPEYLANPNCDIEQFNGLFWFAI